MHEQRASLTADRVAVRRAVHQLVDVPIVFEDPLAIPVLGAERAGALRANPSAFAGGTLASRLRAFVAVRSRVAEDALAQAVANGVRQLVVLGAGLDTFACRNPHDGLRVFEVDHPATQQWKRERLEAAGIAIPPGVSFVAVDFERAADPLPAILHRAGLDPRGSAFFSWLGVTPYLQPDTVYSTLASIASMAGARGGVAFDYMISPESLSPRHRAAYEALAERVAAAGEPFVGSFEPSELVRRVQELGFATVRDLAADDLNARFFAARSDGLQVGMAGRILVAGECAG